jgi:hypothetical protein
MSVPVVEKDLKNGKKDQIQPVNPIRQIAINRMADIFSKAKRSEVMPKIRFKETKLETEFGKALWAKGYRYRKNALG